MCTSSNCRFFWSKACEPFAGRAAEPNAPIPICRNQYEGNVVECTEGKNSPHKVPARTDGHTSKRADVVEDEGVRPRGREPGSTDGRCAQARSLHREVELNTCDDGNHLHGSSIRQRAAAPPPLQRVRTRAHLSAGCLYSSPRHRGTNHEIGRAHV